MQHRGDVYNRGGEGGYASPVVAEEKPSKLVTYKLTCIHIHIQHSDTYIRTAHSHMHVHTQTLTHTHTYYICSCLVKIF